MMKQQKPGLIGWIASTFIVAVMFLPDVMRGQDIAFGEEYYISRGSMQPDPEQDRIVFMEDGSYTRAEYTGNRLPDTTMFAQRIFYIDDLRGRWEWKDGHLQLFDEEIVKCRCRIVTEAHPEGIGEPCEVTREDDISKTSGKIKIGMGASEWFEGFRVEFQPGRVLKLEPLNDFWVRTGKR